MQSSIVFLALFILLNRLVAAATQQICTTKVGTKAINPVPSTTYALTLTFTKNIQVTSTPLTTITPQAVTTTVTTSTVATATVTASPITDTITTTLTNTAISTITGTSSVTATSTASTTVTNNSGTSTVPAPAGFTAISDGGGYVPKVKARDALGLAARAAAAPQEIVAKLANGKPTLSPQQFPTSVICGQLVETVTAKTNTKTASTTSTITAATPTSTVTQTITSTTTSTVVPDRVTATSTATTSTVITASTETTVTTTTTTTSTSTILNYAATSYAACAANNIIDHANGGKTIEEVDGGTGNRASFVYSGNSYDCCVSCITSSDNCRAFVYVGLSGFECELLIGNSCTPGVPGGGLQYKTSLSDTGPGIPVGNGRCGLVQNGGTGQ